MFLNQFTEARRIFEYDYIYIDAIFLLVWLAVLLWHKRYRALLFSFVIAPIIYSIDALWWWNKSAGTNYPEGTFIREYWIGGTQVPHPTGEFLWIKFGADFMMTISYALFAFSWIWIMFDSLRNKNWRAILGYTGLYLGIWLIIPLLSNITHINDTIVETVRHMDSQMIFWIINAVIGYGILFCVYRHNLKLIGQIFIIGISASLIMELPLYLAGIRPTGISFLFFETIFLLNQGVPYLFLVWDKVLQKQS
ncbi:MAG: hypothetical protein ABH833_03315 [Parcubacteria group bacterium]